MELTIHPQELISAHPWKLARTERSSQFEVAIVEIRDQYGDVGLGEAAPISRYRESIATVEKFLGRVDPSVLKADNWSEVATYLNSLSIGDFAAKCALNIAWNDISAKQQHQTISDHFGLRFEEQTYITSFTIGIDSPDIIKFKVAAAELFPILKIKVGSVYDRENFAALREIASQKPVRVDANEGWKTKELALEMITWLAEDGNVQFIEQPMPAEVSSEDWKWLKKRSPLPIFADESYHSAKDADLIAECFHGVNVKLVKAGGIDGAVDALKAARQRGLTTMLGCMIETSVLISAAAHLSSLCDFLDLDGNLLIKNDPYAGVTAENGVLSFANATEKFGLRVSRR